MIDIAFRATSHVAAWLVWHSLRVSLLADAQSPRPPRERSKGAGAA